MQPRDCQFHFEQSDDYLRLLIELSISLISYFFEECRDIFTDSSPSNAQLYPVHVIEPNQITCDY